MKCLYNIKIMSISVQRPDFDPVKRQTYLKTEHVDVRSKDPINKTTNWYEFMRVADMEAEAPEPRGFVNLPENVTKQDIFRSKVEQRVRDLELFSSIMNKELILPELDEQGNEVILQDGRVKTRPYLFGDVITSTTVLKNYAIQYLTSTSTASFSQSEEYAKMLELLEPKQTGVQTLPYQARRPTPEGKEPEVEEEEEGETGIFATLKSYVPSFLGGADEVDVKKKKKSIYLRNY